MWPNWACCSVKMQVPLFWHLGQAQKWNGDRRYSECRGGPMGGKATSWVDGISFPLRITVLDGRAGGVFWPWCSRCVPDGGPNGSISTSSGFAWRVHDEIHSPTFQEGLERILQWYRVQHTPRGWVRDGFCSTHPDASPLERDGQRWTFYCVFGKYYCHEEFRRQGTSDSGRHLDYCRKGVVCKFIQRDLHFPNTYGRTIYAKPRG